METKYLKAAPTWAASAEMLVTILERSSIHSKEWAREEVLRMGKALDYLLEKEAA